MLQKISTQECTFKRVKEFAYLITVLTNDNNTTAKVKERFLAASNCCFGLQRHLRDRLLSRKTKIMLYKTLICLVPLYSSETWAIAKAEEKRIKLLERRMLRKIYSLM